MSKTIKGHGLVESLGAALHEIKSVREDLQPTARSGFSSAKQRAAADAVRALDRTLAEMKTAIELTLDAEVQS